MPVPDDFEELTVGGRGTGRLARLVERLALHRVRLPFGIPLLTVTVVVAVVVTVVVAQMRSHGRASSGAVLAQQHAAKFDLNAAPVRTVTGLARHRGRLSGYVRETSAAGACARVRPGHHPRPRIESALRAVAPNYRVRDSAEVLDQFAGLCSIQIRARNGAGDTIVVDVAAPGERLRLRPFDHVQTGIDARPGATTNYALVVTRHGFHVLVGATGPARGLPGSNDLVHLALGGALTW